MRQSWALLVAAVAGWPAPAHADFLDDVRRTFQKDIPRVFEQDIPAPSGQGPASIPPRQTSRNRLLGPTHHVTHGQRLGDLVGMGGVTRLHHQL